MFLVVLPHSFFLMGFHVRRAGYVVGIVVRLRAVEHAAGTLLGARDLSVLQNVRTGSEAHLASCSMRFGDFIGVKAAE